jgi:hypothetical protein
MSPYGVDSPDRIKAYAWLTLAAENGSDIAKKNLIDLGICFRILIDERA